MMDHQATMELMGALALDAVSTEEWKAAEAHFQECPDCRDEVVRLRSTAETLSVAARDITPPPALRSRILAAITEDQPQPVRRPVAVQPKMNPVPVAVMRSTQPRQFWQTWFRYAPAAAAGVASVILLVLAGWSTSMRSQLSATEHELNQTRAQLAAGAAGATGANIFTANLWSPKSEPSTRGNLVYMTREKAGMLMAWNLPRPPQGRVYQVWVQGNNQVRSLGVLNLYPDGNGFIYVPDDISNVNAVIVTLEPEPHSPTPTGDTVLETRF